MLQFGSWKLMKSKSLGTVVAVVTEKFLSALQQPQSYINAAFPTYWMRALVKVISGAFIVSTALNLNGIYIKQVPAPSP
jgi:hypothetical protein